MWDSSFRNHREEKRAWQCRHISHSALLSCISFSSDDCDIVDFPYEINMERKKKIDRGFWKQAEVCIRRLAKRQSRFVGCDKKSNWTYVGKLNRCGLTHLSVQGKRGRRKKSLGERSRLWTDCGKNAKYSWYENRLMSERVCAAPNYFLSSFIWLFLCSIGCYRLILWKLHFKKATRGKAETV